MNKKGIKGFTMIEIIIVVVIIGLVAGIAMFNLINMLPKFRVNNAVRTLASNLQWARLKAVSENNNFIVYFYSPDANNIYRYEILDDDDNDGTKDPTETLYDAERYHLPSGIKFGRAKSGVKRTTCGGTIDSDGIHFTGDKVTFTPTGRPDKNGSVYLIPEDDDEDHDQKTIHWRAISVTTNGRIKTWIYDASVENCSNGQGPWK
ncbi:MAG: prepilin-type N-terminal cleavage/methylation domain-containing protein [Candidatus Schekmanbacteria bacterium]|nr:MAG: prepilin-type N-terminal cleavage/methylation domain-containing protein [Candidatus Schekmanbacteria bacterium]